MAENPMAPNSRISGENRSETVAAPSVEHGAEVRGNRAMTDEDRARSMLGVLTGSMIEDKHAYLLAAISTIRADERENCAQVADRHDTGDMRREDMEARRIAASIRSGRFAAAIRARGSE